MVPTVALPPETPDTLQATAVLDVPVTVALNWRVRPVSAWAEVGFRLTVMGSAIVTLAVSEQAGYRRLATMTVKVWRAARVDGALERMSFARW